jgi:two-component system CheB/CheR fusion protein
MASRKKSEKAREPHIAATESGTKPQSHASDSASEEKERVEITAREEKAFSGLPVVGMGASAGGLDAFKKFFSAMPADSGVAFVLIPHLDPTHESLMVELLARQTTMPVVEAKEGMRVEANHVYIIPPNKYMTMSGGALRLTGPVDRRGFQTPIDLFLRSLADDQQERAICIILSGTGGHGALGLKAVKAAGGMSMVQDPKSAEYDHMPSSAVATGLADYVLPPEKMPEALVKYVQHYYINEGEAGATTLLTTDHLPQVVALLRTRTKYDFSCYRKKMLMRRVDRRMGLSQIADLPSYLTVLRENPQEVKRLARDLLISVTSFFRDSEAFRALETQVLENLARTKDPDQPIRVWVPGCATGEEPYSIAMLLLEHLSAAKKNCPLQVFATDLDEEALEVARNGVYPESIVADVSPERLRRFFIRKYEHTLQVNKQLREAVIFAVQNPISDPPFSKLDLISCRNLLIYLEPEVQRKILALLHFALNDGGYLFLGPSETIGRQVDQFATVNKEWRIFQRIGPSRPERVDFPAGPRGKLRDADGPHPIPPAKRPVDFAELAQQFLLDTYAPAAVLINRLNQVFYFSGPTMRFLDQPTGEPTQDLMLLARDGLRTKLRAAIRKGLNENQPVSEKGIRMKRNGDEVSVTIHVRPLLTPRYPDGLLLVTFEDELTPAPSLPAGHEPADDSLIRQLEYELHAMREDLQSTVEELESSNEELKASNEEIMSMNEELQSANEELETSKEELQSLNEELNTVNSQLHDKVEELETANNDMSNLLNSADVGTIFLDTDFRIKRFTPAATRYFKLVGTDIGRSITDIASRFSDPDLLSDCQRVIQDLAAVEKEVAADQDRLCLRRVALYRTLENRIEGVVVSFVDISSRKRMEEELRQLNEELEQLVTDRTTALREREELLGAILNYAAEGIITIDEKGSVLSFNKAAEEMFHYRADEVLGRDLTMLMPPPYYNQPNQFLANYLRTGVRRIIGARRELEGRRKDGSIFPIDLAVSEVRERDRRLFTGIVRDISERRILEREILTTAEREQGRIGQDLHDIVGQELSGMSLMVKNLEQSLDDSPEMRALASKVNAGLKRLLGQVRALSQGLIPVDVGPEGLMAALEELTDRISNQADVACVFRCPEPVQVDDVGIATKLYRIVQEAITNALTHGRAKHITVSLEAEDGRLRLTIQNDGLKIPASASTAKGMGMRIMQHRASLINANLSFKPANGGGTIVTCVLNTNEAP